MSSELNAWATLLQGTFHWYPLHRMLVGPPEPFVDGLVKISCPCVESNPVWCSRWPCIIINSYNKTNQMHWFLKFIFVIKLYMFRTVPLSIVRSFSLYTQQWYVSYRFADSLRAAAGKLSANLYDIYHCCVYSEKLLTMDRGTVWNM